VAAEIALAAGTLAAAMGGRLVAGDSDHYVTGFSIDTRTLAAGDLFFAIVAARDGHEYVAGAVRRRAAGVVVDRPVVVPDGSDSFVIEVADTTRGLQDLAMCGAHRVQRWSRLPAVPGRPRRRT
jgi:UDP-N-acetylmuramoyl-tripeptide--D-alanyl-D-alanine ligase